MAAADGEGPYPGGKRFAFTVIDDTDVATIANVRPIYDLLHHLGMRTTKTVWPVPYPDGESNFAGSETLDDPGYTAFVADLARRGFEITWHGATMESSTRERTLKALERYRDVFGTYPRIHVNHSHNTENIYWGTERLDSRLLRFLVERMLKRPADYSQGHIDTSPYWWGDVCAKHFVYARNLTTSWINTERFNPSLPYRDPARPLVPWWFSASDAEDVHEFNELLSPGNQDRLEREGGFCIVATHFGKGFATNGEVHRDTRMLLERLAKKPGWFPTSGTLLDWLRARRAARPDDNGRLPLPEWRRMQWRWALDLFTRKLRFSRGRARSKPAM